MKTKAKGSHNEHRTMALLEAAGYSCTRSGGSLGAFDVVGIGSADIVRELVDRLEQCGVVVKVQGTGSPSGGEQ